MRCNFISVIINSNIEVSRQMRAQTAQGDILHLLLRKLFTQRK